MKTKELLQLRSRAIAESYFYADEDCEFPWLPFEDIDENVLQDYVQDLAETIYTSMLWAQEGLSSCD